MKRPVVILLALAVVGVGALAVNMIRGQGGIHGQPLAQVSVPQLSAAAMAGQVAFEANCAACHGENAAGRDGAGPPLIHRIYEPNHHGDAAFFLAARQGVRSHHWPFGNMPPVAGVSDDEVASIVAYVRELQRANGIY